MFGQNAYRSESENVFFVSVFFDQFVAGVHNAADDFSVKLDDKVQLRQKVGMRTHYVSQIMLVAARNIQVPKSFSDDVFHFGAVFFFFVSDGNHGRLSVK